MKKYRNLIVVILILSFLMTTVVSVSAIESLNWNSEEKGATVSISSINSKYNNASSKVNTAVKAVQSKVSQLYDLNFELLESDIALAKANLERMETLKSQINSSSSTTDPVVVEFESLYSSIETVCERISFSLVESKAVSARSTWYRPSEKTFAEIKKNVEKFKNAGINLIFIETFYHGCSAFRTDISDIPYHPDLAQSYTDTVNNVVYNDYLSAFVALCVENGIEVHAWTENFYVGIKMNARIITEHPDWIMYNDDDTVLQRKEGGEYIFIDPANVEVQNLLINYYNELFQKHPEVKGLNLDYIRYPVSNRSVDTGYTMAAMKGFYESLGKEFSEAQLADRTKMANKFKQLFNADYLLGGQAEADANYDKWVAYRTQVITDYVYRIKKEVKDKNDIVLSTAVFASVSESLYSKKQDWQTWFNEGWIEIATPMAYYTSASTVGARVKDMIALGGNKCLYYTGIASSYSGLPANQNKEFIEASYNAGACGYVIFSGAQILNLPDVQEVLSSGVNHKWAVLPHARLDLVLEAGLCDILDKAERIYIPAGAMSESDREALKAKINEILNMPFSTNEEIETILGSVQALKNEASAFASGYAVQRIEENLNYLAEILEARSLMPIIVDEDTGDDLPPDDSTEDGEDDGSSEDFDEDGKEDGKDDGSSSEDENNSSNQNEPVKQGFFARIIQAIIDFFKKLFGLA